jgi:hypothetical protein
MPNKGTKKDHLKKTSLGPLRQGQWLDTSETKLRSSKERKPTNKARKPQRAPPAHMQDSLNQCNPLDEFMQTTWRKQSSRISSALTGQTGLHHQTGVQHMHRTSTLTGQTVQPDRSDRCATEPRNDSKPPETF